MLTRQRRTSGATGLIAVLDVGSSKVSSIIASAEPGRPGEPPSIRILGVGHQRSKGIKAGVIVDLDSAETAVRAAVGQSERMAGVEIEKVFLAVSCGRLQSLHFSAHADVENRIVTDYDVARAVQAGRVYAEREGRSLVHMNRLGVRLDGQGPIREPRGMSGQRLSLQLHAVTADDAPLRNLVLMIERCHLAPAGLVPTALASGLAVATPDERRLGVTCVDIGGGSTTLGVFGDGQFLWTEVLPVGGNHVTFDLARQLETPLAEAERIKALYGTVVKAPSDDREFVSYPLAGGDEPELCQTTKSYVRQIVEPRMQLILKLIRERLDASGMARYGGGRVVLTGGGSQIVGLAPFAAEVLGVPVRVARPAPIGGVPANLCTPAFATSLGLIAAAVTPDIDVSGYREREALAAGYFGRMGQWLRESF